MSIEVDVLQGVWAALVNKETLLLLLFILLPLLSAKLLADDANSFVGKDDITYGLGRRACRNLVAVTIFGCAVELFVLTHSVLDMLICTAIGTILSYCGAKLWWGTQTTTKESPTEGAK